MGFGAPSRAYPSWSLNEETSRSLIRHAIDAGINFFDTANMYSNGHRDQTSAESNQKIVEAVIAIAKERGVSQASIALARLRSKPVVAAPIVGALKAKHIDDAIAALSVSLTDEEVARLELPYTPRMDYQGVSDPVMLARAVEAATGFKASAA